MTPRELGLALRGAAEAEARRLRADQGIAYSQAHLMGYAFHAPRKTPRFDRVFPDPMRRRRPQTQEDAMAAMRAWTSHIESAMRQRGQIKDATA